VSTQVLQELFVTLTRKVSQPCSSDEALAVLEDLTAWPLMTIDYAAIRAAVRLASQATLSFWAALVVVAAARTGAAVLYTEDMNEGQEILGVRISNPFTQS
jgi:predicted nucleic acid-binding protein